MNVVVAAHSRTDLTSGGGGGGDVSNQIANDDDTSNSNSDSSNYSFKQDQQTLLQNILEPGSKYIIYFINIEDNQCL